MLDDSFFSLESMNPSQIRVLEPFVIVIAKKPWEVIHIFCLDPSLLLPGR